MADDRPPERGETELNTMSNYAFDVLERELQSPEPDQDFDDGVSPAPDPPSATNVDPTTVSQPTGDLVTAERFESSSGSPIDHDASGAGDVTGAEPAGPLRGKELDSAVQAFSDAARATWIPAECYVPPAPAESAEERS